MVFYPLDSVIRLLYVTWVRWSRWVLEMVTAAWAINNLWQLAFIEICKWFLQLISKKPCLGCNCNCNCNCNWDPARNLGKAKSGLNCSKFSKIVSTSPQVPIQNQGSSCKCRGSFWNKGKAKSGSSKSYKNMLQIFYNYVHSSFV